MVAAVVVPTRWSAILVMGKDGSRESQGGRPQRDIVAARIHCA